MNRLYALRLHLHGVMIIGLILPLPVGLILIFTTYLLGLKSTLFYAYLGLLIEPESQPARAMLFSFYDITVAYGFSFGETLVAMCFVASAWGFSAYLSYLFSYFVFNRLEKSYPILHQLTNGMSIKGIWWK